MKTVLKANGLAAGYPKRRVLTEIDAAVGAGTFTALIGANGSGKSTLLRTLAGVQRPLEGSVEIDGRRPDEMNRRELARSLAMVFTDRSGGGGLTVEETVEIGRHPYTGLLGRLSADDKAAVAAAIAAVGLKGMEKRLAGTLSDGERQKVMIARALAQDTPLIILDEPTAFLDVAGRIEITALLRRLADNGKTIILSTHDVSSAIAAADFVWTVDKGAGRAVLSPVSEAVASGILEKAFPGLRFDKNTLSFCLSTK